MRIKQPISQSRSIVLGVIGVLFLCVFYEFLSLYEYQINPQNTTTPNIKQLYNGFKEICAPRNSNLKSVFGLEDSEKITWWSSVKSAWIYKDLIETYGRLFTGLFLGCIISILVGVAMGCYESIAALFLPPLSLLAKVPGTALMTVFFAIFHTGETMFVSMIAFGVLPTLTQAIYLSAKHDVHEEGINKAATLGASLFEIIIDVVFRSILPKILENIRLQIGPAMVCLIAAEALAADVGMGYRVRQQGKMLQMAVVYDYLLVLGFTGLIMDKLMLELRRWACPWYSRFR